MTINTRPPTTTSIVQSRSKSHFVSQMSSREAMESPKAKAKSVERLNISIEDAIKNISATNKLDTANSNTVEPEQKIFKKFWSMPSGVNSDKVWKNQRDQRAESEIIARQRKHDDLQDEAFLKSLKIKHKISY